MKSEALSIRATASRFRVRPSRVSADYHAGRLPGNRRGLRTILINTEKAADLYGA